MPNKTASGERIGAHRRFLQQARLGKHKAPAGGSGIEKIVGAKASSAGKPHGTPDGDEASERDNGHGKATTRWPCTAKSTPWG